MILPSHLHLDRFWRTFSRNTALKIKLHEQLLTCLVIISKVSEISKFNILIKSNRHNKAEIKTNAEIKPTQPLKAILCNNSTSCWTLMPLLFLASSMDLYYIIGKTILLTLEGDWLTPDEQTTGLHLLSCVLTSSLYANLKFLQISTISSIKSFSACQFIP